MSETIQTSAEALKASRSAGSPGGVGAIAETPLFRPRPFLKWAGGKGSLLSEILRRVPENFDRYVEPFLGGGAVFFALAPKRALLSDLNEELINTFTMVRNHPEDLLEHLRSHKHSRKYFSNLRDLDRSSDYWTRNSIEKASRLIYLNKTCFNGLYRVNSRGEFNVPFGDYKNPNFADTENIHACSQALQHVDLRSGPFENLEADIRKGDFVYFDPPYVPLNASSNFESYTKDGFGPENQQRLADFCRRLDAKGISFMLSNSDTSFVRELFSAFQIEVVQAARAINSKSERRGKVSEVIVRNYS